MKLSSTLLKNFVGKKVRLEFIGAVSWQAEIVEIHKDCLLVKKLKNNSQLSQLHKDSLRKYESVCMVFISTINCISLPAEDEDTNMDISNQIIKQFNGQK